MHMLLSSEPDQATINAEAVAVASQTNTSLGNLFSNLIFGVAQKDLAAADGLYRSEISKFVTYPDLRIYQLDQLLWFAGYAFGYGESFGFPLNLNNQSPLTGNSDLLSDLEPDPVLAATFLNIALQSAQASYQLLSRRPRSERDIRACVLLFAVQYLMPEVLSYSPETLMSWQALYQQALSVTSQTQQRNVATWITYVRDQRTKTARSKSSAQSDTTNLDTALDRAERIRPDVSVIGCMRISRPRIYPTKI